MAKVTNTSVTEYLVYLPEAVSPASDSASSVVASAPAVVVTASVAVACAPVVSAAAAVVAGADVDAPAAAVVACAAADVVAAAPVVATAAAAVSSRNIVECQRSNSGTGCGTKHDLSQVDKQRYECLADPVFGFG